MIKENFLPFNRGGYFNLKYVKCIYIERTHETYIGPERNGVFALPDPSDYIQHYQIVAIMENNDEIGPSKMAVSEEFNSYAQAASALDALMKKHCLLT